LVEATVALAVWMLLAAGASGILVYIARVSEQTVSAQSSFENARASLDAILVNIQLADNILIETDSSWTLKQLTLTQLDPDSKPHDYIFYFNKDAAQGEAKYHRLEFGLNSEFASQIESVKVVLESEKRISVSVTTDGTRGESVTLSGSVDARYKDVAAVIK